jgi:hypothetical protein
MNEAVIKNAVGLARGGKTKTKTHSGPIHSSVAGRTDHLPMHVASGSYVIPADIISAMGEGNSMAGFKVAQNIFSAPGPYGQSTGSLPYGASGLPYGVPSPRKAAGGGMSKAPPARPAGLGGGNKGYTGLKDMVDGGGPGQRGSTFKGGPFSNALNSMGVKPLGGGYDSVRDRFDGGGAGQSGNVFQDGLVSFALNALGVKPLGSKDAAEAPSANPYVRTYTPSVPAAAPAKVGAEIPPFDTATMLDLDRKRLQDASQNVPLPVAIPPYKYASGGAAPEADYKKMPGFFRAAQMHADKPGSAGFHGEMMYTALGGDKEQPGGAMYAPSVGKAASAQPTSGPATDNPYGKSMYTPSIGSGYASGGSTDAVPIVAAGGEYVIPPHDVMHLGGGDLDHGHKILDAFVKKMREKTIKTLQRLPGPKKD